MTTRIASPMSLPSQAHTRMQVLVSCVAPSSPRSRPGAGAQQTVAATPPGDLPLRRRTRRALLAYHPRLLQPGRAVSFIERVPYWSCTPGVHLEPPPTRRSPQRSKPPGCPQKKAPADLLRATEKVQG